MTNEEREALVAQGWTPPVAGDPDLAEAREIVAQLYDVSWPERANAIRKGDQDHNVENVSALTGIKRGRALAAEAKPGMVWVKRDFATAQRHPARSQQIVCVEYSSGSFAADFGVNIYWPIITPPEDVA